MKKAKKIWAAMLSVTMVFSMMPVMSCKGGNCHEKNIYIP